MIPKTNELHREIVEHLSNAERDLKEARICDDVILASEKMFKAAFTIELLKPLHKQINEHPDGVINYVKDVLGEWEYSLLHNHIRPCSTNPVYNAAWIVRVEVLSRLYCNLQETLNIATKVKRKLTEKRENKNEK